MSPQHPEGWLRVAAIAMLFVIMLFFYAHMIQAEEKKASPWPGNQQETTYTLDEKVAVSVGEMLSLVLGGYFVPIAEISAADRIGMPECVDGAENIGMIQSGATKYSLCSNTLDEVAE